NAGDGHEPKEEEPARFPQELLKRSAGARQEYFETECFISHRLLEEAVAATLRAICPPGGDMTARRLGSTVNVLGPSRVGKSTLIRILEKLLLEMYHDQMVADDGFIPFASILAPDPGTTHFEWDYCRAILRSLSDPFVDGKIARLLARDLHEAMETAFVER